MKSAAAPAATKSAPAPPRTQNASTPTPTGRLATATAGVAVLSSIALLRVALDADGTRAYLFGRPVGHGCRIRVLFGAPCPTCGLGRALGHAVHGRVTDAVHFFPPAPFALAGAAALGVALLGLAAGQTLAPGLSAARFARVLRHAALGYAAAIAALGLGTWAARLVLPSASFFASLTAP